ncbi:ATPase [Chryseobacterium sp. 6424]|uniref:SRPBCC family protein n=1 Tax=Chryseobacterium sp. 6424 TaxID=2039166 RepID=UPI000EFA8F27|nr:SRPBCC domain-containing protein [Chryseobacterium sp. 6424]AYO57870.1 ATPase [Chryseobacterium sp. 6424]
MATFNYEIIIKAPRQKIWDLLWNPETYKEWKQFFAPGSQFRSDWEVNGETFFLNAEGSGLYSTIKSLHEPAEVVFSHLGMVREGRVDTATVNQLEWSGAEEKYFLREIDSQTTELRAIIHTTRDIENMMNEGFSKGFEYLKTLAEK